MRLDPLPTDEALRAPPDFDADSARDAWDRAADTYVRARRYSKAKRSQQPSSRITLSASGKRT